MIWSDCHKAFFIPIIISTILNSDATQIKRIFGSAYGGGAEKSTLETCWLFI